MAGQVSIPVQNRSGRVFTVAGVAAAVIATSQWAHWMGLADWDLLSLIPGFAQATSLTANQYPNGKGFDCPNQSLGAEAAMMSDEMLKSVGHALCSKDELQVAAALRGTADIYGHRNWTSGGRRAVRQAAVPRLELRADPMMYEPVAKRFEVASIEPVRVQTARDLLEDITVRKQRSDVIDPCSGAIARSAAGCDGEPPAGGDDHHSGGGDTGHDDDGHIDLGDNEHSGDDRDDDDHSGEDSHGGDDGDSSHDGDDDNSGHDSSGDYADNGDSHGGSDDGDSYNGGDSGGDSDSEDRSGSSDGDSRSGSDSGDREDDSDGGRHGGGDSEDDNSGSGSGSSGSGSHG